MNKKQQNAVFDQCVDILENVANAVALTITLTETTSTPLEIVKDSLRAYEEFLNLSPEERALVEQQTDEALTKLVEMNPEIEVVDNRPKKKKTKKELLN